MLMIVFIHFQPTEEKHHVLDFHSDNCPWLHVSETGRAFGDVKALLALLCLALLVIAGFVVALLWRKLFGANGSKSSVDLNR